MSGSHIKTNKETMEAAAQREPSNSSAEKKRELRTKTYIIPYLPFSRRAGYLVAGTALVMGITSIACIVASQLINMPAYVLPITIPLTVIASAVICAFITLERDIAKRISIKVCDEGITFPYMFKPDMLFRPMRPWSDIANILLGSMLLNDAKGAYEFDLEKADDSKKLFIYFKSGGHATIDLNRMSKKGAELLFVALESWCLEFSRSPQFRLGENSDDSRFIGKQANPEKEIPQSFTELWEQEMQDHFSATNFVPLKKGKLLKAGRLRVLMQIAAGGLSAIYLAETPEKELRVLKEATLPLTLAESTREKAKELFLREATILQRLSHPKIARVLDYFVEDNRDYLVLEFVPGHTVRQLVRQNGPFNESDVLTYSMKIADILEYLHCQNPPVIHRDITPDNIVLREDDEIVIIDFGAANEFLGTATGTLVGKQAYISPEQFRGRAQTQSDIYSLGGTLHYMLTGKDPEALAESHPRSLNSDISPDVDELVARATAQELQERIADATTFYAAAEQLLEQGPGGVIDIRARDGES
ncbi:MAG: serine/threonine protein kinase [Candidatus Obscuribacterales bacterium]|nr:serine/threonine protein kinase [Candidatus Obscuribacterales bacterium]